MHRLIEWVTDLIDDYGESFIEAPLKTLSKTVSWIFSIVIGVMSVVAYIKFIAGGGYPHAIATIKNSEEGFFAGVGDTFTNGTVHMVANNGVKTRNLGIPLIPKDRINTAFLSIHIAKIYIQKVYLDENILPRCRFPCSRG